MKHIVKIMTAFLMILWFAPDGFGQVTEENPEVKWNFVRSDSVELIEGNMYIYKFPAKKNHDYIVTFQHGQPAREITIEIYDMQGKLVAGKTEIPGVGSTDMEFQVVHNATYELRVRIGDVTPDNPEKYTTLLSLLER